MDLRKRLAGTYRQLHGPLGSAAAAEVLVPLLIDLVKPNSVVDIGCGVGSFLAVLQRHGVADIVGVDALAVDPELLVVDRALVEQVDLNEPLDLQRRFDLALCLEVGGYLADHDRLVATLVRHAPVIAFSSAVTQPGPAPSAVRCVPQRLGAALRSARLPAARPLPGAALERRAAAVLVPPEPGPFRHRRNA